MITVVETKAYLNIINGIWSEEERSEFLTYIAGNYTQGDIIQGTNGLRKIRWSRSGMGKRGGVRVIYYYYDETAPIFLLAAYAKSSQGNLTSQDKQVLSVFADQLKKSIKSRRRD